DDDSRVYAKVLSPEERSADLLFRAYRFVRLKNVGDERPFSSLRRSAEHEALVALLARSARVRTPALRTVAAVGDESMVLVYTAVTGTPLDRMAPDQISDEILVDVWHQLAAMRRRGIAHRNLRLNSLITDRDGPWVVEFAFGEVAADDRALAGDVAQLLVSLAVAVGPERATSTALRVLDVGAVETALPLLQPGALAGATRAALKHQPHLLDELRHVLERHGVPAPPELAQLERFNRRKLLMLATLGLATYFLIPQFGNVGDIINRVGDANWWWFIPVLATGALTFVGATLAVMGSVNQRLPSVATLLAQVASSFASKLAPAGLGGMALNTRFIQKAGVDPAVAVSSVGLNFVAGVMVHILMLVTFAVWAGRDAFGSISLPDPVIALYGLAGVVVVTAVSFAIPAVRHQVTGRLVPIVRRALSGIGGTLRHPGKVALLFGGSALVTTSYLVALFFAVEAFGGSGLSFAQVGAIYLAASAVATVAPTPGGLGALEAACIAGLVAAGMPNEIAVPSVFLYRLATFWIPVAPGWLAFTYLQRTDYL
ncbi:MAG: lysylphosphatidylglycerol synthase domain-containing protein, partial [Acidimicrobiia bacterium]